MLNKRRWNIWTLTALFLFLATALADRASAQNGDWYNLDPEADGVWGVSANKAHELIREKGIQLKPVIVAVIDDGVDIDHPDFQERIWENKGETQGDGVDRDGNGFVDDLYGWNFLGNPKGENVEFETLEITRLLRGAKAQFAERAEADIPRAERRAYQKYLSYKEVYDQEIGEAQEEFAQFSQLTAIYSGALAYARERLGREDLSIEGLLSHVPEDADERQVFDFLLMAEREGLKEYLEEASEYFDAKLNYHYNMDFDPRHMVNDDDTVPHGNPMVWTSNPNHGTHVAGIIAAVRGNTIGVDGISSNAVILPVRAVPNGDERDKDVAAAIRYAVDQGARVINMSFGKPYSPDEELVRDAIRYAQRKGVLMVHAAGNDGQSNDVIPNYPDGTLGKRRSAKHWITVAASGPALDSTFLAEFSNYGRRKVDVMAPGVNIRSLEPGEGTTSSSGTSMAAPVVSGVAALVLGVNPDLNPKQVKKIILSSAVSLKDHEVGVDGEQLPLKKLLRSPVLVSAERAVQAAIDTL